MRSRSRDRSVENARADLDSLPYGRRVGQQEGPYSVLKRPLGYSTFGHLMGCLTLIVIAALVMVSFAFVVAHYG
jgi:hypothetical protein